MVVCSAKADDACGAAPAADGAAGMNSADASARHVKEEEFLQYGEESEATVFEEEDVEDPKSLKDILEIVKAAGSDSLLVNFWVVAEIKIKCSSLFGTNYFFIRGHRGP